MFSNIVNQTDPSIGLSSALLRASQKFKAEFGLTILQKTFHDFFSPERRLLPTTSPNYHSLSYIGICPKNSTVCLKQMEDNLIGIRSLQRRNHSFCTPSTGYGAFNSSITSQMHLSSSYLYFKAPISLHRRGILKIFERVSS